jgi:ACS family glucarate transporter-like MFS transporter
MTTASPALAKPTRVRYSVLGFACSLSMITYLDRVCFGTVAPYIQEEFSLSDTQKGMLFSAFALAYAAFEVPSGWLGDMYGARRTLIRIVLWWSFFTALTGLIFPGLAFAFVILLAVRFLFGMGEAGAYPNIARAFHNWFPYEERGFAKGAVWMAGRFAGGITAFIVLALLFESVVGQQKVVHWRHTFWIFGALGVMWCVLFWYWFHDHPHEHPAVNEAELALIKAGDAHHLPAWTENESHAEGIVAGEQGYLSGSPPGSGLQIREGSPPAAVRRDESGEATPSVRLTNANPTGVPWKALLTDWNLWALCAMYFCAAYGWYFNITYLPGYLRDYFGFQADEKWTAGWWTFSFMAGAPLLFGSVACLLGGWLSDAFIKRTGNRKWGRRLFGVLGHSLCALCYYSSLLADSAWLFVLAIALAAFWNDMTMGAAWASCIDIGKRYSGIVAGCMNTVGNLGGFAAGFITGWIIDLAKASAGEGASKEALLEASKPGWTINFLIFGGVYVAATVLWFFFDPTKPVAQEVRD